MKKPHVRIVFEPRDLWVGLYWKTCDEGWSKVLTLYVCILPMLPIVVTLAWGTPERPRSWREV